VYLTWSMPMSEAEEQNNKQPKGKGAGPTWSFNGSVVGPGSQIGPFRIEQELGRGGAGVVYLAHDTKLDRSVAIKSLPANHPNIATIYEEFEEVEGVGYLILEYVPGQTLAERIAKKPLKLEEALSIALQIAEAVAAAHEHDVIHRDLKPGNVKITPEGKVKVLDFGLAKAVGGEGLDQQSTVTEPGRVIGTPAYMSPEQARGKPADKRSDIWSFGCVLYEMVTGRMAFGGETISDTLANILDREPNWLALSDTMPANIQVLLRRCLEKDPRRRLRDIGDIAIPLEDTTVELQRSTLPTETVKAEPVQPAKWSRRALPWFITGMAVATVVFLGLVIGLKLGRPPEEQEGKPISLPTAGPIKAIVVLPFENLSGDPEQEYFVDGMTDALSAELGKIKALRVISRTSAMQYKETDKVIPEIAKELDVDAIIEGSVLKAGNDVRVTAQLVDGRTNAHLWSDNYTGALTNILALQSQVTLAIAQEIEAALTPEEEVRITRTETVNPEAYEAYLKGIFFFEKLTEEGFKTAADHFNRAIEIEPDYTEAYAWLAAAYWAPSVWGYVRPHESVARAKTYANTAIRLDETCAVAHDVMGWIALNYDWDWQRAKQSSERAIELNPNYSYGYSSLAWYLVVAGRFDEAIEMMQTAVKLDPLSPALNNHLANVHMYSGQVEPAVEQRKETLKLDPSHLDTLSDLARDYLIMSKYADAEKSIEEALNHHGRTAGLVASLARTYALWGRKSEAEKLLQELQDRDRDEYILPSDFARVHAALGNKDEAFRWLEMAQQERESYMIQLRVSPWWDSLRSDTRFEDLVQRMNFPEAPVSEIAAEPSEVAKAPIEKIAEPAVKTVSLEPLPPQVSLLMSRGDSIAISPDGKYLVYVGVDSLGIRRLYLRDRTKDFEATPIRGTEGAMCPFFRPDGNWIGFFAKDESTAQCDLKRVRIQGGAPEFICTVAPVPCGGCWSEDDFIIYSPIYHVSLIKIHAFSGAREYIVRVDPNNGEHGQAWPDILPEGKGVLYTVWGGNSYKDYRTMIKWKDIDKPQELLPNSSFARYVPTGHVVFLREGSLQAVRFDIDHPGPEAIAGEAEMLLEDIGVTTWGSAQFGFSRDEGTLIYVNGPTPMGLHEGEMVWFEPEESKVTPIPNSRRYYNEWSHPRLSPDENLIAVTPAYETNLLLYKFGIGYSLPLTVMKGYQGSAVWEPQAGSNHVIFYSLDADSPPDIYWCLLNNSESTELFYKDPNSTQASSFSPDGKYLAFTVHYVLEAGINQTSDIWLFDTETRNRTNQTNTPQCNEWGAAFSPDGKWIAYTSDQMGEHEVYVREFPGGKTEKIGSGSEAAWAPDKQKMELYYRNGKQFIRAQIQTEPQFDVKRKALFDDVYLKTRFPSHRNYDISKDGKRFLMIKPVDEQPTPVTRLKVVTNWFEELKRFVPKKKKK
jgi:TolB-like protein/Flp pilus assembly protein TadD